MQNKKIKIISMVVAALMVFSAVFAATSNGFSVNGESVRQNQLSGDWQTPINEDEFILQWKTNASILEEKDVLGWDKIPGIPVMLENDLYIRINGILYKLDIRTGEALASAVSKSGNNMYGHWMDHADCQGGMILDGLGQRALDMDLNYIYKFDKEHFKFSFYNGKPQTLNCVSDIFKTADLSAPFPLFSFSFLIGRLN